MTALTAPADSARAASGPLAERVDESAFAVLYEALAPAMTGYAASQLRDPSAAADLVQEAFVRVLASGFEPQNEQHLRRYLFRTLTHLVCDRFRAARHESSGAAPEAVAPQRDGDPRRLDLRRAFATLAPREQRALWLAHVGGFDHRAIAQVLDVRAASVRVILFRARRKLALRVELGTNVEEVVR